jgi:hypothetical protein
MNLSPNIIYYVINQMALIKYSKNGLPYTLMYSADLVGFI